MSNHTLSRGDILWGVKKNHTNRLQLVLEVLPHRRRAVPLLH